MAGYAYIAWDTSMPTLWHADAGVCIGGKSKILRNYGLFAENSEKQTEVFEGMGIREALTVPEKQMSEASRVSIARLKRQGCNDQQARLAILARFGQSSFEIVALFTRLSDATLEQIAAKQGELQQAGKKWTVSWNCAHVASYTVYAGGHGPKVRHGMLLTPRDLYDDCLRRERELGIEWLYLHPGAAHFATLQRLRRERFQERQNEKPPVERPNVMF